jgi:hypothetical protein
MFVRNVETSWGDAARMNLLDKLVFPYAVPNQDRETELMELLGDRPVLQAEEDENFYKNEDFRAKANG